MQGLRFAGPDVRDAGAERQPVRRGQQHRQLDEGVLAADDLVRPDGPVPGTFQPPHGLALALDRRGAGERNRQVDADGPQGRHGTPSEVVWSFHRGAAERVRSNDCFADVTRSVHHRSSPELRWRHGRPRSPSGARLRRHRRTPALRPRRRRAAPHAVVAEPADRAAGAAGGCPPAGPHPAGHAAHRSRRGVPPARRGPAAGRGARDGPRAGGRAAQPDHRRLHREPDRHAGGARAAPPPPRRRGAHPAPRAGTTPARRCWSTASTWRSSGCRCGRRGCT